MTTIKERVAALFTRSYHRVFVLDEEGGFVATILELPGVNGSGDTIEEANRTLEDAALDWIAIELDRGHDIPAPIDPEQFSGRVTFRIPPSLHYQATLQAQVEGVSLNRLMSSALAMQLDGSAPATAPMMFIDSGMLGPTELRKYAPGTLLESKSQPGLRLRAYMGDVVHGRIAVRTEQEVMDGLPIATMWPADDLKEPDYLTNPLPSPRVPRQLG